MLCCLPYRASVPRSNSINLIPPIYPKFKFQSHFSAPIPNNRNDRYSSLSSSVRRNAAAVGVCKNGVAVAEEEPELPAGLRRELMPKHVAVIMDGNGRWAKRRGLLPSAGHEAGVRSLRLMVELCARWGIQVLTVFAFSTDNWIRPKVEVNFLMSLFESSLKAEADSYAREGIRISVIGDSSKLPKSLKKIINEVEEKTKENTRLQLIVAVGYSGKYDVVQACRSIAEKVAEGVIEVGDIDQRLIEQELETNCTDFPYPDLLIRTSGELRVSNFMLWQLAYTELFFAQHFWPDFGQQEFVQALLSFQERKRRFGGRK